MTKLELFFRLLEYIGTFAGSISGVRLASMKRFDWFGAFVIGFLTALGGGTLRDILLDIQPFWMSSPDYVLVTLSAVFAVFLFGRRWLLGQVTWFIFDTIAISVFMIIGLEKALMYGQPEWVAVIMGVITAAFGGVMRDICINEVPLIFRKELYALACAAGGIVFLGLDWIGIHDYYVRYVSGILTIFVLRALAIKYKLGVPILTGHQHVYHHHHHHHHVKQKKEMK